MIDNRIQKTSLRQLSILGITFYHCLSSITLASSSTCTFWLTWFFLCPSSNYSTYILFSLCIHWLLLYYTMKVYNCMSKSTGAETITRWTTGKYSAIETDSKKQNGKIYSKVMLYLSIQMILYQQTSSFLKFKTQTINTLI